MKQRRPWLWLAVVALGLGLLLAGFSNPGSYRGRPLRKWVCPNSVDGYGPDTMQSYQSNAVAAFTEAGGPGVELLLHELGCESDPWDAWRFDKARTCRWPWLSYWIYARWHAGTPSARTVGASAILDQLPLDDRHPSLLRPRLEKAWAEVDALPSNSRGTHFGVWVYFGGLANALARSGTNGVQVLAEALPRTSDPEQLFLLVGALQRFHTNAEPAVPALQALSARVTNSAPKLSSEIEITLRKIRFDQARSAGR